MAEPEIVVTHNCRPFDWQRVSMMVMYDVDDSDYSTDECGGTDWFDFSRDSADIYVNENGFSLSLNNEWGSQAIYINKYGQLFAMNGAIRKDFLKRALKVLECAKGAAATDATKAALDKDIAILNSIQIGESTGHSSQCGPLPALGFGNYIVKDDNRDKKKLCEENARDTDCDYIISSTGVVKDPDGSFQNKAFTESIREYVDIFSAQYPELNSNPNNVFERIRAFLDFALSKESNIFPVSNEFPYQVNSE